MHERNKFFLFIILLVLFSVFISRYKTRTNPEFKYASTSLVLDFTHKKSLSEEKTQFMESIIRAAQWSNYQIYKKRESLIKIKKSYSHNKKIPGFRKHQLQNLIEEYGVKDLDINDTIGLMKAIDELELRLNMIPVRLAVAQAILESAWGTSRFAKEGFAYFGIHCYQPDCGMSFGDHKKIFVKSYIDLQASVEDYMHFLNTKNGPWKFRVARVEYFASENPDIVFLAESLHSYSEIGGNYQKILKDLFNNYIPDSIDDY